MDLRVLGPVEVSLSGGPVALGGLRERQLLAVLVTHRRASLGVHALVEALWGEAAPRTASASLQVAVSRLRKVLGAAAIETASGGYRLLVEPGTLDADRFAAGAARGRQLLEAGDVRAAGRVLRRALAEWRGPAFDGVRGPAPVDAEARALDETRLGVLEDAVGAELTAGLHRDLVPELQQLAAEHPFREGLHAHLMLALYRCDRQAEALTTYDRLRRTLAEELGADPAPDVRELAQRILRQDNVLRGAVRAVPPRRPAIPAVLTPLVGREGTLRELTGLLERGERLVTLTGPGGVGKTRLLLALGEVLAASGTLADARPVVVDLSAVTEGPLVLATVSSALGVSETGNVPLLEVIAASVGREEVVLLLDNLEQVLEPAARILAHLLGACPGLVVVSTSRERLAVGGEREVRVPTLPLPPWGAAPHEVAASPAVDVFCRRARDIDPDFVLTAGNAMTVAELVRRLDGLPLALELAAARTRLLTPGSLLARLERFGLGVLASRARDVPDRHHTLEATIAWSFDGLQDDERRVLQHLAVFTGGAALEALESVAGAEVADVPGCLDSLLDKSLVVSRQGHAGERRITLLETIRSFVVQRLPAGDADVLRERQADVVVGRAAELHDLAWRDADRWTSLLDDEHDNVRAVLDWLLARRRGAAAAALVINVQRYWHERGSHRERRLWLGRVAEQADGADDGLLTVLRLWLAAAEYAVGERDGWFRQVEPLMADLDRLGPQEEWCAASAVLVRRLMNDGRTADALAASERAIARARVLGLPLLLAHCLLPAGVVLAGLERHDEALVVLDEAARLSRGRSRSYLELCESNLAWVEVMSGLPERARDRLRPLLASGRVNDRDVLVQFGARENLGWACVGTGRPHEALDHFAEALELSGRQHVDDARDSLVGVAAAAAAAGDAGLAGAALATEQEVAADGPPLTSWTARRRADTERLLGAACADARPLPVAELAVAARAAARARRHDEGPLVGGAPR
jgi:predicted ATPase/DNA-binding SARP family transcriptional activator